MAHAMRHRLPMTGVGALLLLLTLSRASPAQPPVAAPVPETWRTLETDHFRIHFRPPAEAFAREVTARVERVREEVAQRVGDFPERKVDVVIGEPLAVASARGLPFREGPRVLLHAAPPSSTRLEDFDDWIAVSLGYELAHVAHLSRPPENRAISLLTRSLPVTPLVLHLPDWVAGGYASSIADRLRCAAAPRRPLAAALLGELAEGRSIPDPGELHGQAAWPRVSLDEVVGAEFLSWLEARPRGSLPEVWRRMTASAPRTFRGSVAQTFGAPLDRLYDEWRRELESRAAAPVAEAPGAPLDATSAPDVAADGSVLVALGHRRRPRLAVLDRDGEMTHFLDLDGVDSAIEPRWLADGSVVFARRVAGRADEGGSDLYRWWPETKRLVRVTFGAVLRAVDGDGQTVLAVENRWGSSSIVRVPLDRESGAIETVVGPTEGAILDSPRLSPDRRRVAFLRHRGAGWRLVVRDLESRAERELGEPGLRVLAWPSWTPDGRWIVVTVGSGDSVRLEAWPASETSERSGRRLLADPRSIAMGAAFDDGDPAGGREPALVYLAVGGEPPVVSLVRQPWPADAPGSWPAAPAAPRVASPGRCAIPVAAVAPSRPYGHGPTTYSSLLAGGFSPSGHNVLGGWRGGDVIGRWEAVAITNAAADGAETGGIVSGSWRGWRLPLQFHGYAVERRPSRQPEKVPGLRESLDVVERGFAVETGWRHERERRTLDLGAVAMAQKLSLRGGPTVERYAMQLRGDGDWIVALRETAQMRLGTSLSATRGWTDSTAWLRYGGEVRGGLSLSLGRRIYSLDASWSGLRVEHPGLVQDRLILGGAASSLIPPRFDLGRLYEAALPAGTRIGDRWESQRLVLGHENTPIRLFWARHRLWDEGARRGDWLRLGGIELTADRDARPVYRLPSSTVRVGAAYVLDEPFRHRWMLWAGLAWTL